MQINVSRAIAFISKLLEAQSHIAWSKRKPRTGSWMAHQLSKDTVMMGHLHAPLDVPGSNPGPGNFMSKVSAAC